MSRTVSRSVSRMYGLVYADGREGGRGGSLMTARRLLLSAAALAGLLTMCGLPLAAGAGPG